MGHVAAPSNYRPRWHRAASSFLAVLAMSLLAIFLSLRENLFVWLLGQMLISILTWHWMSIVHSCGHGSYFRSPLFNSIAGTVASLFCYFPYFSWKRVHQLHHKWTGYRGLDPTSTEANPETMKPFTKTLINFAWKYWLPLLGVGFLVTGFYHLGRVMKYGRNRTEKSLIAFSVLIIPAVHLPLLLLFPLEYARCFLMALFLFGILADPILISQHCDIPNAIRPEGQARPHPATEQDFYSRTLKFPRWVERFVFAEFTNHSVHHVYPSVPHYLQYQLHFTPFRHEPAWDWIIRARRRSGVDLICSQVQKSTEPKLDGQSS